MTAADLASGKSHKDENFPVASVLIARKHRPAIMAFYNFARAADDVADNPGATPGAKLALLEQMRAGVAGESDVSPEAATLRRVLAARGLSSQHALDLLEAFRRDCSKTRYASWDELIDYCRYSAMPVGRFVLDVHGESRAAWPANDALCAALQVINHLQDCAKDYRELGRVYLPLDVLGPAGLSVEVLAQPKAPPALRAVLAGLAHRTAGLLDRSRPFAAQIRDRRLALEVSVIQTLAEDLDRRLLSRDPLSERVHHRRGEMPGLLLRALMRFAGARLRPKRGGVEQVQRP
ncbi:MAG TPA: squalene synthase HpnC [Rhizomicrobium sp.]|jgi:squalene synthase HpnC|nr:squalene synthase HpnC [Rhizomicrobium sp.]